jgi:hypothetical protein
MKTRLEREFHRINHLQKQLEKDRNNLILELDQQKFQLLKRTFTATPVSTTRIPKSKPKKKKAKKSSRK